MPSQQSKKYNVGELSIIVENIDKKVDGINENIEKLSSILSDMLKYKSEMEGMAKATKYWTALIVTFIMAISGVIFKLSLDNIKNSILIQTSRNDDITYGKMTKYIDSKYEIKEVNIK